MGVNRCSYFRCENTSKMNSMFRFPIKDKNLLKVWLDNCGNMAIAQMPPEVLRSRFVCIAHFDRKYMSNETGRRKRLLKTAIPAPYKDPEAVEQRCTSSPGPSDLRVQKPKNTYGIMRLLNEVPEEPDESLSNAHWNTPKRSKHKQEIKDEDTSVHLPAEDEVKIKVFCSKYRTAEEIQNDQAKMIIANVYHYFEQEYEELKKMCEGLDLTPLSKFRQRTALATGVSEATVREILQEEERRNADKPQEQVRKRGIPLKRPRQAHCEQAQMNPIPVNVKVEQPDDQINDSSEYTTHTRTQTTHEDSFERNVVGGEPSGTTYTTEILIVKEEPLETYNEEPDIEAELMRVDVKVEPDDSGDNDELADPLFVEVKIEPRNQEATNSNETRAVQPATKCYKGRTRGRNSEGSSGTFTPPGTSAPPGPATTSRGMLLFQEDKIKVEEIEIQIKEEGLS